MTPKMAAKNLAKARKDFARFVAATADGTARIFVGIDPGAGGAIAVVCGGRQAVANIPVKTKAIKKVRKRSEADQAATGKKTERFDGSTTLFDFAAIADLMRVLNPVKDRLVVALEEGQVQVAGHGSSLLTGFKVGVAYGMWLLYLASRGFPVYVFRPQAWKKEMGLDPDKERSRMLALKKYPRADLKLKKDHDKAEALLLAWFLEHHHADYTPGY